MAELAGMQSNREEEVPVQREWWGFKVPECQAQGGRKDLGLDRNGGKWRSIDNWGRWQVLPWRFMVGTAWRQR